jgi:hypothetical protein
MTARAYPVLVPPTSVWDRTHTACLGCCRMQGDCEPTVIVNTPNRYLLEARCGECRAAMQVQA